MAIDNIFLGLGRKSVGDVTLYRRAGKQCARVRVRNIRNPRTYKQLLTRSILSNVAQLYAAGIEIFDHSFEGRSVGMENQKRFMKLNVDRLRALMVADYNSQAAQADCKGRIGARNLKCPVPFPGLQVSEGNYSQSLFSYTQEGYGFVIAPVDGDASVSAYAHRVGLVPNDIYTFVVFNVKPWKDFIANYGPEGTYEHLNCIFPCYMAYAQLKVRADVYDDTSAISQSDDLLKLFEYYGGEDISDVGIGDVIDPTAVLTGQSCGGIACIRSKWGTDLRSTSFLQMSDSTGWDYGLTYHHLEAAWGDQAGISRADLILDGSNFDPGSNGFDVNQYIGTQITIFDSTDVLAAVSAMEVGQNLTVLDNGFVTVLHRDSAAQITVNYFDTLGENVPTLRYDLASGTNVKIIYAWAEDALAADWFTEFQDYFGSLDITFVEGLPISTFPKPTISLVV